MNVIGHDQIHAQSFSRKRPLMVVIPLCHLCKRHLLLGLQRWISFKFTLKKFCEQSRLELKASLIADAITKDWMPKLRILALLILEQETPTGIVAEAMCTTQLDDKIILLDDPFVHAGEYHRIDHDGAKLLHQIESQVGASIAIGVQIAHIGV